MNQCIYVYICISYIYVNKSFSFLAQGQRTSERSTPKINKSHEFNENCIIIGDFDMLLRKPTCPIGDRHA